MFIHFWDTRTEKTICEIEGSESVPRVGETVCFAYNKELDCGMWLVLGVTWNHFLLNDGTFPYVDVELTPYKGRDWEGSADTMLDSVLIREEA